MKELDKLAAEYKITPKLKLGIKAEGGGVQSTGPHAIRLAAEPVRVMGTNPETGKPRKEMKFLVEENGRTYKWIVPLLNKEETEPNYLIEHLMPFNVGDVITVEMKRRGIKNYIQVTGNGEVEQVPDMEDENGGHDAA